MCADELVLISRSVNMSQKMSDICDSKANYLHLRFIVLKSDVLCVGKNFSANCARLFINRCHIDFARQTKYLDAYLVGSILKLFTHELK